MKNIRIVIKPFQVFADIEDRDQLVEAIMLQLEEIQESDFFVVGDANEDEDDTYGEEYED